MRLLKPLIRYVVVVAVDYHFERNRFFLEAHFLIFENSSGVQPASLFALYFELLIKALVADNRSSPDHTRNSVEIQGQYVDQLALFEPIDGSKYTAKCQKCDFCDFIDFRFLSELRPLLVHMEKDEKCQYINKNYEFVLIKIYVAIENQYSYEEMLVIFGVYQVGAYRKIYDDEADG